MYPFDTVHDWGIDVEQYNRRGHIDLPNTFVWVRLKVRPSLRQLCTKSKHIYFSYRLN